ncbi:hypothetical protein WICPIJ_000341 [Wickerhamomyces pijperi]|uniref:Uncharacterized protein n=1 Tax=Wickerhamomyces pijperi TaxID=599730 RepID=A0A9P8QGK7_WICPI|nr:hypothetical protein WICPIJ_000341 [Wickerhamomyces pijperi]
MADPAVETPSPNPDFNIATPTASLTNSHSIDLPLHWALETEYTGRVDPLNSIPTPQSGTTDTRGTVGGVKFLWDDEPFARCFSEAISAVQCTTAGVDDLIARGQRCLLVQLQRITVRLALCWTDVDHIGIGLR